MPTGVHNGKRGRKPLPPAEREARRLIATRKAANKWHYSHKHKANDTKREKRFRWKPKRDRQSATQEGLSIWRTIDLLAPSYVIVRGPGNQRKIETWEDAHAMLKRLGLAEKEEPKTTPKKGVPQWTKKRKKPHPKAAC